MFGNRTASLLDVKQKWAPNPNGELVLDVGGVLWGVDMLEKACKETRDLHAEVQRVAQAEAANKAQESSQIKPGTVNGATVGLGAGATPTTDEFTQAQKDIKTLREYLRWTLRPAPTIAVAEAITRLDEMADALAKDGLPLKNAKRIIYELRSELNAARSETGARREYNTRSNDLLKKLRGDIDMFLRNR